MEPFSKPCVKWSKRVSCISSFLKCLYNLIWSKHAGKAVRFVIDHRCWPFICSFPIPIHGVVYVDLFWSGRRLLNRVCRLLDRRTWTRWQLCMILNYFVYSISFFLSDNMFDDSIHRIRSSTRRVTMRNVWFVGLNECSQLPIVKPIQPQSQQLPQVLMPPQLSPLLKVVADEAACYNQRHTYTSSYVIGNACDAVGERIETDKTNPQKLWMSIDVLLEHGCEFMFWRRVVFSVLPWEGCRSAKTYQRCYIACFQVMCGVACHIDSSRC